MCQFFSFMIDRNKKVYALLGKDRAEAILKHKNPDSHTYIAFHYNINEDQTWKFELPLTIEDLKKALADGTISELVSIRRLKYDGGLPDEELKTSHENAIRAFLDGIDWEKAVIAPMENPEKVLYGERIAEIKEIIDDHEKYPVGRWAFLLHINHAEAILNRWLIYDFKEDRKFDRVEDWGQLQLQVHNSALIEDTVFFAITKRRYYDNKQSEVKTKVRVVVSGFRDYTNKDKEE